MMKKTEDSTFKGLLLLECLLCGLCVANTSQRFNSRSGSESEAKMARERERRDLNVRFHLEIKHLEDHLKTVSEK